MKLLGESSEQFLQAKQKRFRILLWGAMVRGAYLSLGDAVAADRDLEEGGESRLFPTVTIYGPFVAMECRDLLDGDLPSHVMIRPNDGPASTVPHLHATHRQ